MKTEQMLERLIKGPRGWCMTSIVGLAGQGKTTLARKLYNHHKVVSCFHCRLWCCVSQTYEQRTLLLELLAQIVELETDEIRHKDDEELTKMLYKYLKGRRFLVVFDDIWNVDAWNSLKRCFPLQHNRRSRIVFTSRLRELPFEQHVRIDLHPLSNDESWELLRKKLFHRENCPPELLEVGRQLAKSCEGLPLSIISTTKLLKKTQKTVERWEQIAQNLKSHILGDSKTQSRNEMEMSYKDMPNYLKPCFLYFGAFLKNKEVPVSKLIRLWIAEVFIKNSDHDLESLEDVAERYLKDLISRSLVIVAQERSIYGAKSCRLHDLLLHEFCLTKAKEENFLEQIDGYDTHFPSSNNNLDFGVNTNYSYCSTSIVYHLRRLSICSETNHFTMLKPSGSFVQSLFFSVAGDISLSYSHDILFLFRNFKFFRILNLEGINTGDSSKAVDGLVLLRYLSIQGYLDFIPRSLSNLWNLETFIYKGLSDKVIKVPDSIWDMLKLRHVHIEDRASFDVKPHRFENPHMLDNLQTFSTPCLSYGDDMEQILRRIRGIRKLKCIFLDSWDDIKNCNRFPDLGFLNQLVLLRVFYNGKGKYPCKFGFPQNLVKLTLSNFRMPWNKISELSKLLRNLKVLKLQDNAFEGEIWEMKDEYFPNLEILKLDTLNIREWKWNANAYIFPKLERLILRQCVQLEEIPPIFGDKYLCFPLHLIEVIRCNPSVANSAKMIKEDRVSDEEYFQIRVEPVSSSPPM